MLIGIDASRANRAHKTGVEWYSFYLIQELKKIPVKAGDTFVLYGSGELKGELSNLPGHWYAKILKWPLKYFWTQIRLSWEMMFNPPDVLFVPSHALPIFCRAKTVITLHDLGFERFPKAYSFCQKNYLKFVYKWAVKRANKIIVPSEFTRQELINLYKAEENKIEKIYLAYQPETFRLISDQEKAESVLIKYKIKKPYLLYIGRLEKKKNTLGLLKAWQEISRADNNLNLVLVGPEGYGFEEVRELLNKLKNKIIYLPYIGQDETPYLYSGAVCFVFPSFYEGFGLPILEAMACGCPVVASKVASIHEVGGEALEYFNPQEIDDMVGTIRKIVYNSEIREQMIARGLARVNNFSWAKCAQETLSVLKNL
ncbi:MAG: glycosyltransferase family 1 protein [Patescibacteria group bacterium]|nr:glycosyltransferase family 1 protein [Patescibacteria group bacterium]MDD5121695.1 glycosyltransferase family 1 protein [Patescibacteria group bacterium]MDD5221690.1 glycosyltransferase family 1 protein [Patescibacteria group bacterium]MDD5396141.1 glycosyltransferase family 1 protein [Patescibacteria group bacterium]